MKFTLYVSDCKGNAKNTYYKNKVEINSVEDLKKAVAYDHVESLYNNGYRNTSNFKNSDVAVLDCDNMHSDNPKDWITPEMYKEIFPNVKLAVVPSRNNMKLKNGKVARPRHHVYFPHKQIEDCKESSYLKSRIFDLFSYFDGNALDATRFIFGNDANEILWIEGSKTIDEYLQELNTLNDFTSQTIVEGSRNSTMSRIAGKVIKRLGITEEAYKYFMEKSSLCNPPLPEEELNQIWKSAVRFGKKVMSQPGYIPPNEYSKDPEWEMPIPFDEYSLPSFPINTLPEVIRNYAIAIAESTQTPIDMAATSAIAVLSVCLQGKYKVQPKQDWTEPLNTFVLNVMEPSERKSAVESAMVKPLNIYEQEYNKKNAGLFEKTKMQKRILEKRQRVIEEQFSKGKATDEDVTKIADEIANFKELKPLKLFVDDITAEKLVSVLADSDEKTAILSSESGIFDTLAGKYSQMVGIDAMLKGYSGDSIKVDRIGRTSEVINNPKLTILLMAQPCVIQGLMQNSSFRNRGLTARFLYCRPLSFVGKRVYRSKPLTKDVYIKYESCITNLLEDESVDELITFSKEADLLIEKFSNELEPRLKGDLSDISDWAGKLVGNICRIAGLICRSSTHRTTDFLKVPDPLVVSKEQMESAIKIGEYFIEHAKSIFMIMSNSSEVKDNCKKVVEFLKRKGKSEFNRRDLMRQFKTLENADAAQLVINRLIDYGYIAEKNTFASVKGGRPALPVYIVNPLIFD